MSELKTSTILVYLIKLNKQKKIMRVKVKKGDAHVHYSFFYKYLIYLIQRNKI